MTPAAFLSPFNGPRFTRYVVVGALNTAFSFLLFALLAGVMHLQYLVVLAIVWIASLILTYSLNFIWSFQIASVLVYDARFVRYAIVYLCGFLENAGLLTLAIDGLAVQSVLAQAIIFPVTVASNYLAMAFWALR